MVSKFPTGKSFQRLKNIPLDETIVFDTLAQAQSYAKNNLTAYKGQVVHVKDARTPSEIDAGVFIYEETCYIDLLKNVKPICSFTYEAMGLFFDLMYEILDGPTEETRNKLDNLYELMYDDYAHDFNEMPTGDYHTQPWHPANYNDYQICLEMSRETSDLVIGKYDVVADLWSMVIEGANYTVENFQAQDENGINKYYKVVSLDSFPTRISFGKGTYITKVIHMCDTSNVTTMKTMFFECISLTELDVSDFDTSKVTDISNMFTRCTSLTTIKGLTNFNTSNVTFMDWIFQECTALTTLNCSGWDLSKVTGMAFIFTSCNSLVSVDLSNWDVSNVTYMGGGMFDSCKSLTNLDLSNWDISNVTNMRGFFAGCDSLTFDNIIMTNCSEDTINKIKTEYDDII